MKIETNTIERSMKLKANFWNKIDKALTRLARKTKGKFKWTKWNEIINVRGDVKNDTTKI